MGQCSMGHFFDNRADYGVMFRLWGRLWGNALTMGQFSMGQCSDYGAILYGAML